jgi:O-acetyl-ADP-ribose deacetylase (regulator of RNase III)
MSTEFIDMPQDSSIFDSSAEALVNPVNCEGISGRGLALEFKRRFPAAFADYKRACAEGWLKPGGIWISSSWQGGFLLDSLERIIVHLPTKNSWRDSSTLEPIERSLRQIAWMIHETTIRTVAIPALGCGLGGLDWSEVRPTIVRALDGIDGLIVYLYPPREEA